MKYLVPGKTLVGCGVGLIQARLRAVLGGQVPNDRTILPVVMGSPMRPKGLVVPEPSVRPMELITLRFRISDGLQDGLQSRVLFGSTGPVSDGYEVMDR